MTLLSVALNVVTSQKQHSIVALKQHLVYGQEAGDILYGAASVVVIAHEQVRIRAVVAFSPQPGEDGLRVVS